jgi:hypothetical protein
MNAVACYVLSWAGGAMVIEARGPAAARVAGFVGAPWSGSTGAGRDAPPAFRLADEPETGRVSLFEGERRLTCSGDSGWLADRLVRAAGARLAASSSEVLAFHAAALAWQGQGILLPGGTAAGKSTLACWLALQGWGYLTDELAAVPLGGISLDGLSRPLSLKTSALPLFGSAFDFTRPSEGVLPTPHGALIAPARLPAPPPRPIPLARIVFPDYRAGGAFLLSPLSPARAAARLMGGLLNARKLPADGLAETVRLAGRVPAFRLRYGNFTQLGDRGQELWGDPTGSPDGV